MNATIFHSRSNDNYISGPRNALHHLHVNDGEPLVLHCGRRFTSVSFARIRVRNGSDIRLYVSGLVLRKLCVSPGLRLHIASGAPARNPSGSVAAVAGDFGGSFARDSGGSVVRDDGGSVPQVSGRVGAYAGHRHLRLGPILGVCAFYEWESRTFVGQGNFFKVLLRQSRLHGMLAYVFAPGDVDWERGTVHGVTYVGGRAGWVRETFPLPDVVYNRIQTRQLEGRKDAQTALGRFARMPSVALFNRCFLDKWAVHGLLQQDPDLAPYVPRTERLTDSGTLNRMFAGANSLFVKPVDGSLGDGIAIIRRGIDGAYSYRYYTATGSVDGHRLRSADGLWRALQPHIGNRPHIVQHDIRLARYRGRRFDLRLIAQRDRSGRWRMVTAYARVARAGEYRTNVGVGGRVLSWGTVLQSAFGRRSAGVARRVMRAADHIARGFAKANREFVGTHAGTSVAAPHGSPVGELAIDIGVDKHGRPWLIELNSKPVRHIDPRIRTAPRSVTTLLDYCTMLAGF